LKSIALWRAAASSGAITLPMGRPLRLPSIETRHLCMLLMYDAAAKKNESTNCVGSFLFHKVSVFVFEQMMADVSDLVRLK
jgi:hypothetical protein